MILVLEASTTSVKALLFDPGKAAVVRIAAESYSYADTGGESGTQNADAVFARIIKLGRELAAGFEIEALAPTGTFHSILVCDKTMKPVTPAFTWEYTGARATAAELRASPEYTKRYYHRSGCMVHALYPAFQLLHLKRQEFCFTDTVIFTQSGYNFWRLTGERCETKSTISGSGMLNIHKLEYDRELCAEIGITAGQMGRLADYYQTVPLSAEGAELLGLKAGIPVLPPYPDGALNQVAAGALVPDIMTCSVGTSAALRLSVSQPLIPETPSTWCYRSPVSWMIGAATNGACNCVDWAKNNLFPHNSYAEVEKEPVDFSAMPFFLPFLFGERCPGWMDSRQGGFFRLRAGHSAKDMYFSVLEGILFNLYQCFESLCATAGIPRHIQLSGGILNSSSWKRMCADIFGREMECAKVSQASLLGGAVLGMAVTGYLEDLKSYKVEIHEVITPDFEKHRLFEERYRTYKELYRYEAASLCPV
ncbi:MAG: FGGY-family carbohydrate kinase [Treponema sp.]|jgi:gluconokinase|nr:FGGY-family carbohydrate kinase [Treponema sp.]